MLQIKTGNKKTEVGTNAKLIPTSQASVGIKKTLLSAAARIADSGKGYLGLASIIPQSRNCRKEGARSDMWT